jgi:hypothetical protein
MKPASRRRVLVFLLGAAYLVFTSSLLLADAKESKPEDAIFVYDVFAGAPACPQIEQRLAAMPLRPTVILSIEQGREFLLSSAEGTARLTCALAWLQRHDHRVKAMLVQDRSFINMHDAAVRRMGLLAQYAQHQPIAGAVIDVEPYSDPDWGCSANVKRRALISRYKALLRDLRQAADPLPLETAEPWWAGSLKDVPEMQPSVLFQDVSGMYLMLYGDEGGPLVGNSTDGIAARVPPDGVYFGARQALGRVYLGLATYEAASPEALNRAIASLQERYSGVPGFAGTAIFHAGSTYNAPLVRIVAGQVVDATGEGVAGAEVELAGIKTHTGTCGNFELRGVQSPAGELQVRNSGYETQSRHVQVSQPGRETEAGVITLPRAK